MHEAKPTNDHQKAFMLSLALGAVADVRQSEQPRSRRHRKMMDLEDRICSTVDEFRPEAWPPEMMAVADRLLDRVNQMIAEELK
jgi:hypothetical protein